MEWVRCSRMLIETPPNVIGICGKERLNSKERNMILVITFPLQTAIMSPEVTTKGKGRRYKEKGVLQKYGNYAYNKGDG